MSAGHLLYLSWNDELPRLDTLLKSQGLVLRGRAERPQIGIDLEQVFGQRVAAALDPQGRFAFAAAG